MKLFSLFILVFYFLCGSAQERLTEYESGGTNFTNHLRTVDGKHYLLQADITDMMHVYELVSPSEKVYLHSHFVPNIHRFQNSIFEAGSLYYDKKNVLYKYDFVTDILTDLQLPDGYIFGRVYDVQNSQVLVRAFGNGANALLLIHPEHGVFDIGLGGIVRAYENHLLRVVYNSANYGYDYIVHDYLENSSDTIAKNLLSNSQAIVEGNFIYFVDQDGQVKTFNMVTKQSHVLMNVFFPLPEVEDVSLHVKEDKLYLWATKLGQTSFSENETHFKIYDFNSNDLIDSFMVRIYGTVEEINIFNNILVAESSSDILQFINLDTDELYSSRTRSAFYDTLIEDKYVLNARQRSFGDPVVLELIDINSFEVIPLGYETDIDPVLSSGLATFEDAAVVLLNDFDQQRQHLFNIDLFDYSAEQNATLDNSELGIVEGSKLVPFNGGLIVLSYDLLYYKDGEVNAIDEREKVSFQHAINDDIIYFGSQSQNEILGFDGEEFRQIANISGHLNGIAVKDDLLYYYNSDLEIIKVNLVSGETEIVSILSSSSSFTPEVGVFELIDGVLYFQELDLLYRYDEQGGKKLVVEDFFPVYRAEEVLPLINGELLVTTREGLMKQTDVGTIELVYSMGDDFSIDKYIKSKSGDHLVFSSREGEVFYFDGNDVIELDLPFEDARSIVPMYEDIYYISDGYSQSSIQLLFQASQKKIERLPDDLWILDVLFEKDDALKLVVREEVGSFNHKFSIYSMTKDLEDLSFESDLPAFNRDILVYDVAIIDDLGLLKAGRQLYTINQSSESYKLDLRVGVFSELHEINGNIYFLGIDPILGGQIYRYNPAISSITESDIEQTVLSVVYPNPVTDMLYVDIPYSDDKEYCIYSLNGKQLSCSSFMESIDVSPLSTGIYFIEIYTKDRMWSEKFIKN